MSPPSRRRGLKHFTYDPDVDNYEVASLAEAWIETRADDRGNPKPGVASLAEAWIETFIFWMMKEINNVASLAEAWIETSNNS